MATNAPATPRDDFVAKLVTDPRQPPDTLLLTGWVGKSSDEGYTRLYFDAQLSNYVEIPQDAILLTQDMPADAGGLGGSYLWIKRDATLIYGPIGPNRRKASFLEGPLAQQGAGLATPQIPPPTAPVACSLALVVCHPTVPAVQCPPHTTPAAGCPVHTTPAAGCPVHTTPAAGCPVPTTPQAGCPVPTTPAAHCPIPTTPAAHCPPHTVPVQVCHPSVLAAVCQTQFAHCPTNILPCPHPQAAMAALAQPVPQPAPFPPTLPPGCPIVTHTPPFCGAFTHFPQCPPPTLIPHCPPPPTHQFCPPPPSLLCPPPTHIQVFCPIQTHTPICQIHTLPVICQPVSGAAICQINSLACPSGAVCGPQIPGMPGVNPV